MPDILSVDKTFALDQGIFTNVALTLSASADQAAAAAILSNACFPDGDVALGHVSFSADTGAVSIQAASVDGATVTFDLAGSAQSGIGVYGKVADAIAAMGLADTPHFTIADQPGRRYLLIDAGYSASATGSASAPVGMLGSVTFGVNAKSDAIYAILSSFDPKRGSGDVLRDAASSWRLPRQVALTGGDVNIKPGTWLITELDGSLSFTLGTSLGWDMSYAKDLKILGVTHNLSAKIDASVAANLGFNVAGKYILVVGREQADSVVRLQLWKQSSKGLNFGFNLQVGVQGADPQLPGNFDDFIESTFGVHGLQVLNDLRDWTDPTADLGQKIAGLTDQTIQDLLKRTTNFDPAVEFDKAKALVTDALAKWTSLPQTVSSMVWSYLEKLEGNNPPIDFKQFLTDVSNPATAPAAFATALQNVTFADTPQGKFLEAVAERGLLALSTDLAPVSKAAGQVLDVLNGGVIAKLQNFIDEKLNLAQIEAAIDAASFDKIDQWLQNRLANFLDKTLDLDDLKDVQQGIHTLQAKASDFYKTAIDALTKRYSAEFAATYQSTTSDTALLDVNFDLSRAPASKLFASVMAGGGLDTLLSTETDGVTLNQAVLTHEINRNGTVDLHMPFFDFSSTSVNDSVASLQAEDQGAGRVLLYQVTASDTQTVANRTMSQLSVLASLTVDAAGVPTLSTDGSIAYQMLQVKAGMRPADLESRTTDFIHQYLGGTFTGGDASVRSFYTDLDIALSTAAGNKSNFLGDMALSMQVSLPVSILGGWLQPRSGQALQADQMSLSRSLQASWKGILPTLFFQDLSAFQPSAAVAALLVWSSFPVSTSFDAGSTPGSGPIQHFNTDKNTFWDWVDPDQRKAIARDPHTLIRLVGKLTDIHNELLGASSSNADFFAPGKAGDFVNQALTDGDIFLKSLLFTEAELIDGATNTLKNAAATLSTAKTSPTQAIKTLAAFAASLTDTFNKRVDSVYSSVSGRVVGPMLFVETSAALASADIKPAGMLNLYALKPAHTFVLGDFVKGVTPSQADIALSQTLLSL